MKNILITGGSGEIGSEIISHLSFGNNKIFFTYNKNYLGAKNICKKIKKYNNNIFFFLKFQIIIKKKLGHQSGE